MNIDSFPSPNHSKQQNTREYIILHGTGSSNFTGTINWLCNPQSRVSYHFVLSKSGQVARLVEPVHIAWHAGISKWQEGRKVWNGLNAYSIGIGFISENRPDEIYPSPQVEAGYELCLVLMEQFNIAPCRILTHKEISYPRKHDPENFNIDEFRKRF